MKKWNYWINMLQIPFSSSFSEYKEQSSIFPHERMSPTHMQCCYTFFLKTQQKTYKMKIGEPNISLNQFNLKVHANDEKWDGRLHYLLVRVTCQDFPHGHLKRRLHFYSLSYLWIGNSVNSLPFHYTKIHSGPCEICQVIPRRPSGDRAISEVHNIIKV